MPVRNRSRRMFLPLALAALLLVPIAARAGTSPPGGDAEDSFSGAMLTIACGASLALTRLAPQPVTVIVAGITCFAAFVDAISSADPR